MCSLIDGFSVAKQALPFLENGELCELMDSRVTETAGDARMVRHMAYAALRCLKIDSDHKLSISEVIKIHYTCYLAFNQRISLPDSLMNHLLFFVFFFSFQISIEISIEMSLLFLLPKIKILNTRVLACIP